MDSSRHASLSKSLSRREVVRLGGAAGLAAVATTRSWGEVQAQDGSPVPVVQATPVAVTGEARFAYVGTYTREAPGGGGTATAVGISVFAVEAGTGALSLVQTVPSDNPSFLALDPTERFLYAGNEIDDYEGGGNGSVEAYAIDPATGEITLINQAAGELDPEKRAELYHQGERILIEDVGAVFIGYPLTGELWQEWVTGLTPRADGARVHHASYWNEISVAAH